jgi:hypothetical protein
VLDEDNNALAIAVLAGNVIIKCKSVAYSDVVVVNSIVGESSIVRTDSIVGESSVIGPIGVAIAKANVAVHNAMMVATTADHTLQLLIV